jgi:hypothetical protein
VLVVLAIVGLFVFIYFGTMAVNDVISRHVHVLRKWTLTKNFIVADLAADDDSPSLSYRSEEMMRMNPLHRSLEDGNGGVELTELPSAPPWSEITTLDRHRYQRLNSLGLID